MGSRSDPPETPIPVFGILGAPARHTPADAEQFRRVYRRYARVDRPHRLCIGPPHQLSYGWFVSRLCDHHAQISLQHDALVVATESDFLFVPGPCEGSCEAWTSSIRDAVELFTCLHGTFGLIGVPPGRP